MHAWNTTEVTAPMARQIKATLVNVDCWPGPILFSPSAELPSQAQVRQYAITKATTVAAYLKVKNSFRSVFEFLKSFYFQFHRIAMHVSYLGIT